MVGIALSLPSGKAQAPASPTSPAGRDGRMGAAPTAQRSQDRLCKAGVSFLLARLIPVAHIRASQTGDVQVDLRQAGVPKGPDKVAIVGL